MGKHVSAAAVLWAVLTVVGLAVSQTDLLPLSHTDKGEEVIHAWKVMMIMGMPVFTFVIAVLVYSIFRFRSRGVPTEDGPPMLGRGLVPRAWLGITTALAVMVMIYPGLTGLSKMIASDPNPDVIVELQGTRWVWIARYPDAGVTSLKELVLPVDSAIRFNITAADVIHSVWVPAFLLKVDAVPGLTTTLSFRTTEEGSFADNENMRLQCAELCGRDHGTMAMPVRVVSRAEYQDWLKQQGGNAAITPDNVPVRAAAP